MRVPHADQQETPGHADAGQMDARADPADQHGRGQLEDDVRREEGEGDDGITHPLAEMEVASHSIYLLLSVSLSELSLFSVFEQNRTKKRRGFVAAFPPVGRWAHSAAAAWRENTYPAMFAAPTVQRSTIKSVQRSQHKTHNPIFQMMGAGAKERTVRPIHQRDEIQGAHNGQDSKVDALQDLALFRGAVPRDGRVDILVALVLFVVRLSLRRVDDVLLVSNRRRQRVFLVVGHGRGVWRGVIC